MSWIGSLLPVWKMAVLASSGSQIVVVVDVASGAGDVGVAVGEREAGSTVIEGCAEPTVELMAAQAICGGEGRPSAGVIRIDRVLPVFQVARIALGGEPEELTYGRALVAGIALDGGVRTE
jgi:hypothetical protein